MMTTNWNSPALDCFHKTAQLRKGRWQTLPVLELAVISLLTAVVSLSLPAGAQEAVGDQTAPQPVKKGVATIQLMTFCISTKTAKPPDGKCEYAVGDHPDKSKPRKFKHMYDTARQLEEKQAFRTVPINPQRRATTLTQLAIWRQEGVSSSNKEDRVTEKNIGDDLLKSTGTPRASLSSDQKKNFDKAIHTIYEALARLDITEKTDPNTEDESQSDKTSIVDGVCSSLDNTICGEISGQVSKGQLKVRLTGDGETTTHVQLELTNQTKLPMMVVIPEGQVFVPQCEGFQYMMARETARAMITPAE